MGNLRSVEKKFERVGAKAIVTSNLSEISNASKLVLPGVGHFASGVTKLKDSGIWDVLNEKVLVKKTPILGICLGMQLMAKSSEEGNIPGFNWIDAEVVRFNVGDTLKFKVPHIGWNTVSLMKDSFLYKNISSDAYFYFVHSYHIKCNNIYDILTTSEYDYKFTSSIQIDNILGTQFHPEKSHDWGETIFKNFSEF